MNTEDDKYQKAKKRVKAIKGLYTHLAVYVLVNGLLFMINIMTSPSVLWFYWPLSGWGIGIVVHAFYVFGFWSWLGPDWEEKKIKEMMD